MKRGKLLWVTFLFFIIFFTGCSTVNRSNIQTVKVVDLNKYSGTWYEIARLPNSFEKGLVCVTANYTLTEDKKILVINKGYEEKNKSKFKTAKGKAYIPNKNEPGKLKVTFFWPFYGNYWIIDLDEENYKYVLVGDPSLKYLWILGREKTMDKAVYNKLIEVAKKYKFETDKLLIVDQSCN